MNILGIVLNVLGIGKEALNNKAKLKQLKIEQEHKIIEARTAAEVDRITSNTDSDNQIDLQTARDKRYTFKDEIVTYLFLIPVFVATITPFIIAKKTGDWTELNENLRNSYETLNELPEWYMYILFAIIIDVLGFRSFARRLINKYIK